MTPSVRHRAIEVHYIIIIIFIIIAIVRPLIHSRLDYYDSELAGLPAYNHVQATSVSMLLLGMSFLTWPSSECVSPDDREVTLARISTSSHGRVVRPDLQKCAWIGTRILAQKM